MATEYNSRIDAKECGVIGDGVTDDTAAMQKSLDGGQRTVCIPRGIYKISSALKVDSHTLIKADAKAIIRLAEHAGVNKDVFLLTNRDYAGGNEDISMEGGIWDGNNEHNPRGKEGDPNGYTGSAINFVNVRRLEIRDLTVRNPEAFSIRICKVNDFVIEDIRFDHTVIRKLRALTQRTPNDDMVALNADDDETRVINLGMKCGPIRDITVEDLQADDAYTFVRLLSVRQLIEDITISNVSGGCRVTAINMNRWRFPAGFGNIRNVTLRDFSVRKMSGSKSDQWANQYPLIHIQSAVHGLRIENFRREPDDNLQASTLVIDNGRQNSLQLEGASGEQDGNKFVLRHGGFSLFTIDSNFDVDSAEAITKLQGRIHCNE